MVLVLEMVLKLVLLGGLIGSITGGILGGIGEGIDYLMQQPKITITQRIQQMMQPNPHGDGALAFKGEYLGVDKAGNQIVASTNDAVVIGHHIPFHVPIHEVNPGLNGFPIEFAVLLAAFAPEAVAASESVTSDISEQTVYRVYGGESRALGQSWTPIDPRNILNYRNAAGLPIENTGRFLIEGTVNNADIILQRGALEIGDNAGGLLEYLIDPANVRISNVFGLNPPF